MKRFILGVLIATLLLYLWGFLYWGLGPYASLIWKQAKDDVAAGEALLQHFPEVGTYYIPASTHDPKTLERLFQKGPIALVHLISTEGRPVMDPSIMVQGFLLNLIVVVLIGLLLRRVSVALLSYSDRVGFVFLAGLTASILIDLGDVVWWRISWDWKLYLAFYHVSAWVLTGLVLGRFVGPVQETGAADE